jgi:hypothetical protein
MRSWVIGVLLEAGTIRECEEHSSMQDQAPTNMRGPGHSTPLA